MTRRGTLQIAAVLGLLAGPAPATAAELRVAGPAETVFDWSRDRCARWDSPDTPARAWRGADGRVRLVAGAEESRASLGPGLDALTHACGILYRGSGADDPAALDDRVWIHAVHAAADGRVSQFPRAWVEIATADGRTGVGWMEWNRSQADQHR